MTGLNDCPITKLVSTGYGLLGDAVLWSVVLGDAVPNGSGLYRALASGEVDGRVDTGTYGNILFISKCNRRSCSIDSDNALFTMLWVPRQYAA